MKHLKLFDDAASYAVWKNGEDYVTPNVSYIEENDTIFYEDDSEFTEDELLYYYNGTDTDYIINLTTLKVKKYPSYTNSSEEDANINEDGSIVVNVDGRIPGSYNTRAMYWTSESVNSTPMNFEYTLYDSSSNKGLSGKFNEMVTFQSDDFTPFRPNQEINLYQEDNPNNEWPILEIKSKISNKTHRIKFV